MKVKGVHEDHSVHVDRQKPRLGGLKISSIALHNAFKVILKVADVSDLMGWSPPSWWRVERA
jgi:hypothetical protein